MPDAQISIEKRTNPRVSVKIPVKFRLVEDKEEIRNIVVWRKKDINAFTLDISLGGMYITVDQPLEIGNIIQLDLFLLDVTNVIGVYAEVVRANKNGAGLTFLMMKTSDRYSLLVFLDKISNA